MRSDLLNWFIYSTSLGVDRCSKSKRLYVGFFCWQNASNSTKISTFPFFLAADKHAICAVDVNMHWSLWIRSFLGDEGEVPASVIYYHFLSSLFIISHSIFFVIIIIFLQFSYLMDSFHIYYQLHISIDSHSTLGELFINDSWKLGLTTICSWSFGQCWPHEQ